ncbi:MAG: hypothetical protein ACRENE_09715 [Polyangiaceae bacterium]
MAVLGAPACSGSIAEQGLDAGEAGASSSPSPQLEGGISFSLPPSDAAAPVEPPPPPPPAGMQKVPPFTDDAGEQCVVMFNRDGAGQTSCIVGLTETCGSTSYYATCRCPQGTCGCFGPTTDVANSPAAPTAPAKR